MRQVFVSALYCCSAVLAIVDLAITREAYTTVDMALAVSGISIWVIASSHTLYCKFQSWYVDECKSQVSDETPEIPSSSSEPPPSMVQNIIRGSTHSTINAALYIISSSLYIAADAIYLDRPSPQLITSFFGSLLWLKSAAMYMWLSQAEERKKEENPKQVIKPLGLHPATYYFMGETEYLICGLLYLLALWADHQINPINALSSICWLLPALHETVRTLKEVIDARLEDSLAHPEALEVEEEYATEYVNEKIEIYVMPRFEEIGSLHDNRLPARYAT